MAGLLDFNDPGTRMGLGLLALGQMPRSQGFQGLLGLMASQDQAEQRKADSAYRDAQIAELQRKGQAAQRQQDMIAGLFSGGQPQASEVAPGAVGSGGFGNASLNQIAALKAMGGPDLLEHYKLNQSGVKMDAGNYYIKDGNAVFLPKAAEGVVIDPRTGQARELPGYAEANASIEAAKTGATEGARYPFTVGADRARQTTAAGLDLVNVPMQDGSSRQMTRLQASGAVGGAGGQGFGVTPSPVNQAAATGLNDNWIKNGYQPAIDAGRAASDISASLQAVRNIDLSTGWGTEAKATAASILTGLGIAPANASMFASNSQKFQSVAMDRLMTTLAAQKGPQTEGDAQRASQTFAQLKNTPDANKFIIDFAQAKANMDMRKAQFYEQALPLARKDGDLTRVDREWRKIQGSIWADPALQQWAK